MNTRSFKLRSAAPRNCLWDTFFEVCALPDTNAVSSQLRTVASALCQTTAPQELQSSLWPSGENHLVTKGVMINETGDDVEHFLKSRIRKARAVSFVKKFGVHSS